MLCQKKKVIVLTGGGRVLNNSGLKSCKLLWN